MKEKVLDIVKSKLGGAEDNLARANMQFGSLTTEKLNLEYEQSGRTCGEILHGYLIQRDELKRCVTWVEITT